MCGAVIIDNYINPKILNKKTGLIKEVTQWLPEYDDPRISVVAAFASNPEFLGIPKIGTNLNSGAGVTLLDAAYAAIGESIERYCSAIVPNDLPIFCSSDFIKKKIVDTEKFEFYSDEQYRKSNFPFKKFTAHSKVAWTETVCLYSEEKVFIPAACVYLPYFADESIEENIWAPVSTGLACGKTRENAKLSGLCEVIERDSFMLFWLLGEHADSLDWTDNAELSAFVSEFYGEQIKYVRLLNITTDIGIPTVLGVFHKLDEGLLVAAATRTSFIEAAKKTLIELAQGRITWRKSFEEEKNKNVDNSVSEYSNIRTFEDRVNLFMNPSMVSKVDFLFKGSSVKISDLENNLVCGNTLEDVVKHMYKTGYRCYSKDLTPDCIGQLGFYVYRCLIPGLLEISNDHLWQRIGHSRLRTYYETMKRDKHFDYEPCHINPVPHPFP